MPGMTMDIATASGGFCGYLSLPAAGTGPGLLLLHDMFGLSRSARAAADLFAEEGYTVLAPELFWRLQPNTDLDEDAGGLQKAVELSRDFDDACGIDDVQAALAALRSRPECRGKIGVLGFGLGGGLACAAATRLPIDAAVALCPAGAERYLDAADSLRCPLGLHFGSADPQTPAEAVAALRQRLAGRTEAALHVYPGVGHGFYLKGRTAYNRSWSQIAHSRVLALLRGALGPQYDLEALWERHLFFEFERRDPEGTMTTMTDQPLNINVPVMSGGVGREGVLRYYREQFLGQMPADCEVVPISRTVGSDRLVDEHLLCFTHSRQMDAMLPGVPPTGRRVELAVVVIVEFRGDKVAGEHIHWDQASLLHQLGLLEAKGALFGGRDNSRKLLDENILAEALARQAEQTALEP